MIPPPPVLRARRVRRALDRLGARDPAPLAQGLRPQNAAFCLEAALAPLTVEALSVQAVPLPVERLPSSVTLVVPWGVFTTPIEWAALYATAGIPVRLKPPSRDPALCLALAEVLGAQGLPVEILHGHALGEAEVIVVMGEDRTGEQVRAEHPDARVLAFGHRVSAAAVEVPADPRELAGALALDLAMYDSRGCMAPVAILASGDAGALARALHEALAELEVHLPRAPLEPALGPEWRRRLGLARALGRAFEGPAWAVTVAPPETLVPAALPRLAAIHPVDAGDLAALDGLPLSSLARQGDWPAAAPRLVAPGELQRPRIPRKHDGVDMLEGVLREG